MASIERHTRETVTIGFNIAHSGVDEIKAGLKEIASAAGEAEAAIKRLSEAIKALNLAAAQGVSLEAGTYTIHDTQKAS